MKVFTVPVLGLGLRRGFALALTAGLAGCASYTAKTQNLRAAWDAGDYPRAANIAAGEMKSNDANVDTVLWDLEAGATARAAGDIHGSMAAFNAADGLFDYWDTQPAVSISRESASLLINPTVLPYRGYDYDRIMESVYQALNYLQLGQFDQARVELTRALERQQTAMTKNADRAQKVQEATANSASSGYDASRAQADPQFQAAMRENFGPLDSLKYYTDYANPFATYLRAVCLLARPQSPSDNESARVDFTRVQAMIGHNPFIDADCALATDVTQGGKLPSLVFVLYETGAAPDRVETRISIPLFLATRDVPYFGVAFPKLNFNPFYNPGLVVQAAGAAPLRTALLCDMDSIIAQEFRNELPDVVVKTLISAGAKATALFAAHQETKNNNLLDVLTQFSGLVYEDVVNHADLRTWVTLPKQIQFCRLITPADHKLYIARAGISESLEVDLPDAPVTMVSIKSTSPLSPLAIQVFPLR
ncbi:MAG TPA: hypothetical protein VK737_08345 [Opitutales bacterium]|nr:hypothetical protein [Opitutales bacterium]